MKFKFFRVAPEDLDAIEAKECYSVGELHCAREMVGLSFGNNETSLALGFGPSNGEILGIAGSYRQWAGSAQLWAVFSPSVDKYPVALLRGCLQLIHYAQYVQKLQRVSLTVKSSYTKGNRFATSLGFSFEGKMQCFLPDASDANLYARLF